MFSFPDYDIGGRRLVWTAPATAAAALRQLGRDGVPHLVGAPRLLTNDLGPRPRVRIDAGQLAEQAVALFGRPGTPPDPLHQFGVALPEARGFHRPDGLPKGRVIRRHFGARR